MEFIRQIYSKFFKLFNSNNKDDNISTENQETHIIFSVDIDSFYNRHINIYIPENIDEENIITLAEAYVSTLLEIGDGNMQQQLLKALNSAIDKNNYIENLLLNNIITLFVQYSQIRSDPSDPLIEPLSVFKK